MGLIYILIDVVETKGRSKEEIRKIIVKETLEDNKKPQETEIKGLTENNSLTTQREAELAEEANPEKKRKKHKKHKKNKHRESKKSKEARYLSEDNRGEEINSEEIQEITPENYAWDTL